MWKNISVVKKYLDSLFDSVIIDIPPCKIYINANNKAKRDVTGTSFCGGQ